MAFAVPKKIASMRTAAHKLLTSNKTLCAILGITTIKTAYHVFTKEYVDAFKTVSEGLAVFGLVGGYGSFHDDKELPLKERIFSSVGPSAVMIVLAGFIWNGVAKYEEYSAIPPAEKAFSEGFNSQQNPSP